MRRVALVVAYDGRAFAGFQRQPGRRTVQGALEAALRDWFGHPVPVVGAGRTDSGVHALGQVVHLDLERPPGPSALVGGLNVRLPPDVRVLNAAPVPADFHARYGARAKTYVYRMVLRSVLYPHDRGLATAVPERLDVAAMAEAAALFRGRHDFAAFSRTGGSARTTVRTLFSVDLVRRGSELFLWLRGDGFLYAMARQIAGALIDVGRGRLSPEAIRRRLAGDRSAPGAATAPPDGLYLFRVEYPPEQLLTPEPAVGFPRPPGLLEARPQAY
ncbi:MAG: tRNA pseudouridine synthase A [Hydrogenibacillus schlegelii]|uniref:tRNA pseudouridine synthase A n=1 Tax=Hydrogenibacillus schlegelii TaxID=1484 RepID=A0A2T5G9G3_HYDSH|nr:tRNA pseudouridine(38-40) synthase TruA [Hydrogenibacillus schlegelii]PTQ52824.1 MAG: tRNA pseudouridine synthase A [Hydrogenibacillus schlegelii]